MYMRFIVQTFGLANHPNLAKIVAWALPISAILGTILLMLN